MSPGWPSLKLVGLAAMPMCLTASNPSSTSALLGILSVIRNSSVVSTVDPSCRAICTVACVDSVIRLSPDTLLIVTATCAKFLRTKKRKKGFFFLMEQEPKKFKSAGTPQEVKEYRAELALALEGLGVPLQTFLLANDKTRFHMSEASLYRHVQSLRSGRPPLSAEKHAGRRPTLSNEQQAVLAGAILCSKDPVDLEWAQAWIMRNFNANVSVATVSHSGWVASQSTTPGRSSIAKGRNFRIVRPGVL
jgi:hypothetical protein